MQDMKSSKEKKRKHTHRESETRRRKKRSAESSVKDPKEEEEAHPSEEVEEEPSDIEEEGLNLNVPFKAISAYLSDRQEMLEQCFHVLGQKKLIKMLPDELKSCSLAEIKALCWDQLQQLTETNLLLILEGKEVTANSEAEEQGTKQTAESQQDNNVDSTSSVKESAGAEDKQDLSGEESDVLSINANMDDSDIEGHRDPKPQQEEVPATAATPPSTQTPPAALPLKPDLESEEPKLELQRDIDKSVSEILALTVPTPTDTDLLQPAAVGATPASLPASVAVPSAQQLALLELEMRARAIKALMKASEVKK